MSAQTWNIISIVGFLLSGIALIAAILIFIKFKIPSVIGDLTGKTVAREIKAMRENNSASGAKLHRPSSVNAARGKLTQQVGNSGAMPSNMSAPSVQAYGVPAPGAVPVAHASKRLDKTSESLNPQAFKQAGYSAEEEEPTTGELYGEKSAISNRPPTQKLPEPNEYETMGAPDDDQEGTALLTGNSTKGICSDEGTALLTGSKEALPEEGTALLTGSDAVELTELSGEDRGAGTTVLEGVSEQPVNPAAVSFRIVRSMVEIHTDEVIE